MFNMAMVLVSVISLSPTSMSINADAHVNATHGQTGNTALIADWNSDDWHRGGWNNGDSHSDDHKRRDDRESNRESSRDSKGEHDPNSGEYGNPYPRGEAPQ